MSLDFLEAKPLQAIKLGVVAGALVFGIAGFVGLIPGQQLPALLLVTFLGPVLAFVIVAETLYAGYRAARADESARACLAARPPYTIGRAVEAVVAVLATGGFVALLGSLPDEPMPAPAGVGLLLVGVGLGLLTLVASLGRTLGEHYLYRRDRAA